MNNTENIKLKIRESLSLINNGKQAKAKQNLKYIYAEIEKSPFILWDDELISHLGKCIIIMIYLDLFDDEDANIKLAHLAFIYISKGIYMEETKTEDVSQEEIFRMRKDRVIILKSFDDFFVDSLISFYFSDNKAKDKDEHYKQRKIVLDKLPLLQHAEIKNIEDEYEDLRNDEFLVQTSNFIEYEASFTHEEFKEGQLLLELLYKHSYKQLVDDNL